MWPAVLRPGATPPKAGTSPARTRDDLPLPEAPEHREQALGPQALAQCPDLGLAAEEERLLVALEGLESGEGAAAVRGGHGLVQGEGGEAQVQHLLGDGIDGVQRRGPLLAGGLAQGVRVRAQGAAQGAGLGLVGFHQDRCPLG